MQSPATKLIASLLTPPGRGAVAVVCLHDPSVLKENRFSLAIDSNFVAVNGRTILDQPISRICYGHWETDSTREDVVVCRTAPSTVEISCHGGRAAVDRILTSLKQTGVTVEDWQSQQAVLSCEFDAEAAHALSQAMTTRTAAILMDQISGTLKNALTGLLDLERDALEARLNTLLAHARFGLHLTEPWRVVLAGRPNVGKSTLINALLGYTRAIVFDQPGTTRDVVTGQAAFDGWPFQLADTAGIRTTTDELERAGIDRARRTVETADLVCLLLDTSQPRTDEDQRFLAEVNNMNTHGPTIIVAHKIDMPNQWNEKVPELALPVSSTTGAGIEELIAQIVKVLIPETPPPGTPVPISRRQVGWLKKAQTMLKSGDHNSSIVAIQNCLAGKSLKNAKQELNSKHEPW